MTAIIGRIRFFQARFNHYWPSRVLLAVLSNHNKRYNDNLYLFQCLALHRGSDPYRLEPAVKTLYATHQDRSRGVGKGSVEDRRAHSRRRLVRTEHKKATKRRVKDAGKKPMSGLLTPGVRPLLKQNSNFNCNI